MSFFHTDKPTRTLSQQIITAFNKMIGVINLRYFIFLMRVMRWRRILPISVMPTRQIISDVV